MIRVIKSSDIPRVAEIQVFGWRCAYRNIVSDDFLFNKMLVSTRMDHFDHAIRSNSEESYVFDDGTIKAFLTIGACRDPDKTDAFELWGLYVDPFMKRQGIGAKMVQFYEEKAAERGFKEICLWVLEKNKGAREFYEKSGYLPDGTSKWIDALAAAEIRYRKNI